MCDRPFIDDNMDAAELQNIIDMPNGHDNLAQTKMCGEAFQCKQCRSLQTVAR